MHIIYVFLTEKFQVISVYHRIENSNMVVATIAIPVLWILMLLLLLRLLFRMSVGRCCCEQDMTGKTVLITGANSGLGKVTALNLAQRNARILMACRNLEKAEKVKSEIISATGNVNVEIKHLDLESFSSVRKCAEDILKTEKRLDVLINNAGVSSFDKVKTKDGWESVMQTNYLGHFLLTLLLLDLLKKSKPSRIINLSSILYLIAILNVEDMDGSKHNWILTHIGNLYNRAKLASLLYTTELASRLDGTGISVNALHPGLILTDIFYSARHPTLLLFRFLVRFIGRSSEEGAQTTIHLALDPDLENVTGKFFYDCQERRLKGKARDRKMARKLFEISEKVVSETCKY